MDSSTCAGSSSDEDDVTTKQNGVVKLADGFANDASDALAYANNLANENKSKLEQEKRSEAVRARKAKKAWEAEEKGGKKQEGWTLVREPTAGSSCTDSDPMAGSDPVEEQDDEPKSEWQKHVENWKAFQKLPEVRLFRTTCWSRH